MRYLSVSLIVLSVLLLCAGSCQARTYQVGDSVFFEYLCSESDAVSVAGTFNEWDTTANPMALVSPGLWRAEIPLKPGRYRFKYFVDGAEWALDDEASVEESDGIVDSVLIVIPSAETVPPAEGTEFIYRSETAESVSVVGAFNHWKPDANPLSDPSGSGEWRTTIYIPPGEYIYMFVIDGTEWRADPEAEHFVPDNFGGENSMIIVP